ncbi:MAG: efflux RND transporter periplasmic adaptor subunit [Steroidobacteraceae bacterium]|nr:efflux RND transporter periplasmic adaptor subunit [Steroidobacteraceae bacterium]
MSSPRFADCRAVFVIFGLTGVAACGGPDGPPEGRGAMPVTVVTLATAPVVLRRELPGRTTPYLVAEVRPQVNGIVKQRLYTEGSAVTAGQPLYQLDDATYQADLASARAALARAEATLNTARLNARRSADLFAINAVSKQEDETAAAALKQGEADVAAAAAAVRSAEVILGYARIKAPIGGRIGKSSVTQGALVTANQEEPLATVQQLDPIYVDLTQSSAEWLALRRDLSAGRLEGTQDMPVAIVLEDGTPYEQPGKLAFSEVSVDPTTGSFALRVVVPNPEHILLPGMYVRAIVGTGTRQAGLLVPQQGIARDPKGHTTAMVVGQDGKVEVRPVRVSQAIGDQWLVEEGLAAGEKVIVEGLQKVQPGAQVQPTEAGAAPPPAAPPAPPAPAAQS